MSLIDVTKVSYIGSLEVDERDDYDTSVVKQYRFYVIVDGVEKLLYVKREKRYHDLVETVSTINTDTVII